MPANNKKGERVKKFFVKDIEQLVEVSNALGYPFHMAHDLQDIKRAVDPNHYRYSDNEAGYCLYQLKQEYWRDVV